MNSFEIPVGDEQLAGTVAPVKRGRGRPKGSKNKPVADLVIPSSAISIEPLVTLPVLIKREDGKDCMDCVEYLLCTKIGTVCEQFQDNFTTDDIEIEDLKIICNNVGDVRCLNCPCSKPHDLMANDTIAECESEHLCDKINAMVKCEAME